MGEVFAICEIKSPRVRSGTVVTLKASDMARRGCTPATRGRQVDFRAQDECGLLCRDEPLGSGERFSAELEISHDERSFGRESPLERSASRLDTQRMGSNLLHSVGSNLIEVSMRLQEVAHLLGNQTATMVAQEYEHVGSDDSTTPTSTS
jgi:hypothetical protein